MKRRLLVSLALAMMLSATVAGPASAMPDGNNGNHYGEYSPYLQNNGKHIGAGAGMGKYANEGLYRRGLK